MIPDWHWPLPSNAFVAELFIILSKKYVLKNYYKSVAQMNVLTIVILKHNLDFNKLTN